MAEKRDGEGKKRKTKKQLFQEAHENTLMGVVAEFYSYAGAAITPSSASKTPSRRKHKSEPSLSELQQNIVRMVAEKIKESTDWLAQLITKNISAIEAIKEQSEYVFQEIQEMKKDAQQARMSTSDREKGSFESEDTISDAERYQRPWTLPLHGLPEEEGEDVKKKSVDICLTGESLQHHMDISHGIGRRRERKARPVLTRFISRSTKDKKWKSVKRSQYLKAKRLHFGEALTAKDKEARNKLWPEVEAAGEEGEKEFIVGTKVIIDVAPEEVQQLPEIKEEVPPEQQERSSSVKQEVTEPLSIKEEPEDLWSSQEGEQLQGPEEADDIKFTCSPDPVKSEDEEKPQSSWLHQQEAEQPETEVKTSEDSSGAETDDSDDWMETAKKKSRLKSVDKLKYTGVKRFKCNMCGRGFTKRGNLNSHIRVHTGEKPFGCSVCGKTFAKKFTLDGHMRVHTGERPYGCSLCGKTFAMKYPLDCHMRIHTGERPFGCPMCGRNFAVKYHLDRHMNTHTREKPFGPFSPAS